MSFRDQWSRLLNLLVVLVLLAGIAMPSPVHAASSVILGWASAIAGASYDNGSSIAVDGTGNVYITGNFSGTVDFDPGTAAFNLTSAGDTDIFVSKLDKYGNLVWAKRMGGASSDSGSDIALDASGGVYSIGDFYGTVDFNPGAGTHNLSSAAGSQDIYLSKLDGNGNFVWAKAVGGTEYDLGNSLALDGAGNLYITGRFTGTADFDPGSGLYAMASIGIYDVFIAKYGGAGGLTWAKQLGGTLSGDGSSTAVDADGNAYTVGDFSGTMDFDPSASTYNLSSSGSADIFVSKLDTNGEFLWAKHMGGADSDDGAGIQVDQSGNVYLTGSFNGTADFDPDAGTHNLTSEGYWDIFVSKLDNTGAFGWAKSMGGPSSDDAYGLALDGSGNVYSVGGFVGTVDFDPGTATFPLTSAGNADVFISKLKPNGDFAWAAKMGGTTLDYGLSVAIDGSGNIHTIGNFAGTADFDPGSGTHYLTGKGYTDIFVSKLTAVSQVQFPSAGDRDGWIRESSETSDIGGTLDTTATVVNVGDDSANKQYRAILSFNTSNLPDNAVIVKVTLKIKRNGATGGGDLLNTFQGFRADIKKGLFANAALELGDFSAAPSKTCGPSSPSLSGTGWYSINLTCGKDYVNKTGNTQLRLRFSLDDNNNNSANFLKLYSGNATAAERPQLIIQYYLP